MDSTDADISFSVSVESSHVAYDHKASNCAKSPGTSNDSDYVPDLVELSEQRQIEIICTEELESYLFNLNVFLRSLDGGNKDDDHVKKIVQYVKRIFQTLEMKKLEDLFLKNNLKNKYLKGYCVEELYKTLTIRKDLGDMSAFLSLLIIDELDDISISSAEILKLKLKIANWSKTYKKGTDLQDWKRKLVEAESLIDETHVQQYEEIKSAMLAKELLQ